MDALGNIAWDQFHLIISLILAFFIIRYIESKLPEGATYKASKYLFH